MKLTIVGWAWKARLPAQCRKTFFIMLMWLPLFLLVYAELHYLPYFSQVFGLDSRFDDSLRQATRESMPGVKMTQSMTSPTTAASTTNWPYSRPTPAFPVKMSQVSASTDIVPKPDQQLQRLFLKHLNNLSYTPGQLRRIDCIGQGKKPPCFLQPCKANFLPPQQRLQRMLGSQYPIEEKYIKVIDDMTDHSGYADIVFITAASADHYEELLGVLKGLQDLIFPRLRREAKYSYKFLCYDMGLTKPQIKKMEKYGNCTAIIRVPIEGLPDSFTDLRTCAWKPLLMRANVHHSKVTIWMDASVRFHNDNINQIVDHALERGIYVSSTGWMMPQHLAVLTLNYFHVQPCLMSPFKEMAGGFLAMHNTQVMRQAVLGPWVSCAFSPECLCPGKNCYARFKPCTGPGPYSRCHRFDQAVLGLILVNLFDWKATSFYGAKIFHFRRAKFGTKFPEMHLARK